MSKIKSIELPEDSRYRLYKKVAIKDAFTIVQGHTIIGALSSNPLAIGSGCQVIGRGYQEAIYTTSIQEIILEEGTRKITFTTENSIYELEEVDDLTNTEET